MNNNTLFVYISTVGYYRLSVHHVHSSIGAMTNRHPLYGFLCVTLQSLCTIDGEELVGCILSQKVGVKRETLIVPPPPPNACNEVEVSKNNYI